ncbi:short-chain dehydrogenase/reductase [Steroidobacter denitrificans]|uniref:Short-chain dehydrogenase/reductase n=1 Tax=Steroidobacter denitrificans TaxID=465721 RepID=A0A127F7K5_STEDE|nr:SDR family oxidoreductase [Steroidobacter denitrificans]AMN45578.1 short-chain dehydrogenase/reductase [Steroidobacter denitrificans]
MGICDGRTVIITGAGGGLGRAYALAFAAEGASVVVNDIRRDAAEAVVAQIVAAGGRALADSGDITTFVGAQGIVDAALSAFGEVHVLVNNAGVLRDRMFLSLSEDDWDTVMRVHLKGHFCLASVLGRRWRDASKAGKPLDARIINTSSGAGLQGSVAQSNYSAAKGGIAALTLVQAVELKRYGITVNSLAPAARTAMTEGAMPEMVKKPASGFDVWDPMNVAAIVVWLGSPLSAHVSGHCFEAKGGELSIAEGWHTGKITDKGARWEPAELTAVIDKLIAEGKPAQPVYGS